MTSHTSENPLSQVLLKVKKPELLDIPGDYECNCKNYTDNQLADPNAGGFYIDGGVKCSPYCLQPLD